MFSTAYLLTQIPPLVPNGVVWANAIADNGDVIGSATFSMMSPETHLFLFHQGKMIDLSSPALVTGYVAGVNDQGQIIGGGTNAAGRTFGFVYQNGVVQGLGALPGDTSTAPRGINNHGLIVGESYNANSTANPHAVYWEGTTPHLIDPDAVTATAVNDAGQIIGHDANFGGFLYANGHVVHRFGADVNPTGINAAGDVVGQYLNSNNYPHAFRYARGIFTDLGTLGGPGSEAPDINDAGVVVGEAGASDGFRHSFVLDHGVMTRLDRVIDPFLGWTLDAPTHINNAGQILVGSYLLNPIAGASITGTVFNDHNGDHLRQSGDGGLGGTTVYIDANGDSRLQFNEFTAVTDANGTYRFDGLPPGRYTVRLNVPGGTEQTLPGNRAGRVVTLATGQHLDGQNFADQRFALYRYVDLGTLGGSSSAALDINNLGQVVGQADTGSAPVNGYALSDAFLYANGKMTDLGTLGGPTSVANAINDAGTIVGSADTTGTDAAGNTITNAVRWTNGKMASLDPNGAAESSAALGINNLGQIVGSLAPPEGVFIYFSDTEAFRYANGVLSAVDLPNAYSVTWAAAINNVGQIAINTDQPGIKGDSEFGHAYLYDGETFHPLGGFPVPGGGGFGGQPPSDVTYARALNDAGEVVGTSNNAAFLYARGRLWNLDALSQFFYNGTHANDINDAGWIVGTSDSNVADEFGDPTPHGFMFVNGRMQDLNEALAPGMPQSWAINAANAINNSNWVVGTATDGNFVKHAVMLVPVLGRITGSVYADWNGDGAHEHGEWSLAGRTVYIDANHNGRLDPGDLTATSDAAGRFTIEGLAAGTYDVRQVLPAGWRQTGPTGRGALIVNLDAGGAADAGALASTAMGAVNGFVFNDRNGNGAIDVGEAGLSAWRVFLDLNGDGKWEPNEPAALTDATGRYAFTGVSPGTYALREVPANNLHPTRPAGGSQLVTIARGQVLAGVNFGNA